jgi:SAM-dependent methyltransferase
VLAAYAAAGRPYAIAAKLQERSSVSQSTTAWNEIFAREGRFFLEPHEDVPKIVQMLQDKRASTVLDLGSGTGRHVVYLAKSGFSVFGLDNSSEGIEATRQWLADEGLEADLQLQSMAERFPYEDGLFDAVLSVQVIHHAALATIRGIVDEIGRVLKQGGFLFVTVPKLRNQGETFEQLEPNTFVPLDGPEKGLPHHYFTHEKLREVFVDYEIVDIHLDAWEHYCLSAFKP